MYGRELEGEELEFGHAGLLYRDSKYLRDHGRWQRIGMFHLGLIIGGGTSQIQRNIIAERGLGLPRESKFLPKIVQKMMDAKHMRA